MTFTHSRTTTLYDYYISGLKIVRVDDLVMILFLNFCFLFTIFMFLGWIQENKFTTDFRVTYLFRIDLVYSTAERLYEVYARDV